MTKEPACPNCDTRGAWSVLVTTQLGVSLPGESRAAREDETRRELRVCEECGTCFDPVIAGDGSESE